jgi:hypothetical protein
MGDDDDRFTKVEKASEALANALQQEPQLVLSCILVGLDPSADAQEPIFDTAEAELLKEWRALRNKFTERPRTLLRATLLDACHRAGMQNPRIAAAAWLTATNILPHFRLGREEKPIRKALNELGTVSEKFALTTSQKAKPPDLPTLPSIQGISKAPPALSKEKFQPFVEAAAGPRNRAGSTLPQPPNPHWPNSPDSWAYEFAPRMTTAMIETVHEGMSLVQARVNDVLMAERTALAAFLIRYGEILQQRIQISESNQRADRDKLAALWWSEAMYSPSLRESYRCLSPEVAAVAMALDLFEQVEAPAPISVAYLLSETVARLPQAGHDRPLPLKNILSALHDHGAPIREMVSQEALPSKGRVPLSALIEQAVLHNSEVASQITMRTGLDPETPFTLPELAMACFRGLQAWALVQPES